MKFCKKNGVLHSRAELKLTILLFKQQTSQTWDILRGSYANALPHDKLRLTGPGPNVSFSLSISFSPSHFPSACLSSHYSVFLHRQTGGVRSGQARLLQA